MKRVVIPVNRDKLSVHFEQCDHYEIFEIYNENTSKKEVRNVKEITSWLMDIGTTDIIAYNIDDKLIKKLTSSKINLFVGIPVNRTRIIIESYLSGNLKSNTQIIKSKKQELIDNN